MTNTSFIINTKASERNRRFRVLWSSKKCIETEAEVTGIYYSEDINYEDSNKNQNDQNVQKIEDIIEEPITVSHPTFCCVGVRLWLRWGWAVTTKVVENTQLD